MMTIEKGFFKGPIYLKARRVLVELMIGLQVIITLEVRVCRGLGMLRCFKVRGVQRHVILLFGFRVLAVVLGFGAFQTGFL